MRRLLMMLTILVMMLTGVAAEETGEGEYSFWDVSGLNPEQIAQMFPDELPGIDNAAEAAEETEAEPELPEANTARDDLIDRIISMGYDLYVKADGKSQRAHYKEDIYVCKNFTTYLFNENRDDFGMEEFPNVKLRVPNNLPSEDCKPYYYGLEWQNVKAKDGNPFYEAASFRYDTKLSMEENLVKACEFMRQAQRGDYFQMSAKYEYGTGAHSAIMLGYDAEKDEIHWMDSNMRGGKNSKGIRYGLVQYDEVRSVEWWASTFCLRGRGATLYRLRDDIIYRGDSK